MSADDIPAALPADIRLTGLGLVLREWTDDDVSVMVELFNDPQVDLWTPLRFPFDQEAARAYLAQARQRRSDGLYVQLAITADGDAPMGEILLFRTGSPGEAELAYAVGPRHRRRRLATRAVQLITGYAYDVLGMDHVLLRITQENRGSVAVAHSAGFALTAATPVTRAGSRHPLHTWRHHRAE
ncbi:GNAT family N-acetyltransferase [Nonomuraea sp. NPDC049725]|uniref:GNAT family N-acetyltransferase n=1 Tax=Nonomuraea sp. NPDC049725 TaxID=3154508 RepID=UPI00344A01B3